MDFLSTLFWRILPFYVFAFMYQDAQGKFRMYVDNIRDIQELVDTYKDIQGVAGVTMMHYKAYQSLPTDFSAFLAKTRSYKPRMTELWQDGWGTPYVLRDYDDKYEIVSCGVDRDCLTEQDNIVERLGKGKSPEGAAPAAPSAQSQRAAEMFKAANDAKEAIEKSQAATEELLKNDPN